MAKAEAGRSTTARVRIFTREELLTRRAGGDGRRPQLDMSRIEAITGSEGRSIDARLTQDAISAINAKCRHLRKEKRDAEDAAKAGPNPSEEARIMEGKVQLMFANPETLVLDPKWRDLLMAERFQNNIIGIVVDEVHKTPSW
ncbi:Hypp6226 [Branchiostoma lanceolatum]|uniref:Hypp6226 protein n=1 Tax=Branchiostoma lanceolatum TaxID=7740 RepID=A0A8J9YRX1_BRALA|nr:Hypp6226 [Branchiostoma lanceolatum]